MVVSADELETRSCSSAPDIDSKLDLEFAQEMLMKDEFKDLRACLEEYGSEG